VTVLADLDLDLAASGYLALMGASGTGKSTLLALIGGLDRPQRGEVTVGGHDLSAMRGGALAAFRRRTVGFIFQHFGLLDTLTATENIELAMALDGVDGERGLDGRADHRPSELSGGERQRVAIARALANRPRLVLADEPTGNLDMVAAAAVMDLLGSVREEHGCTLLVVTHNPLVASRADASRQLVDGRLRPS
jgi:putative ABC transport system ATP-binding protein